ncbi:hypothetical protein ACBJ59_61575 [Nonomuraea sp. MTCD27]|uniref:hypothetical protein n=1 Tax=Nonomuraea sp. MTCD27 TaxID=1676747 RepID=UPI0035BF9059
MHLAGQLADFAAENADCASSNSPAYAPELNPTEGVWSLLRRALANFAVTDLHDRLYEFNLCIGLRDVCARSRWLGTPRATAGCHSGVRRLAIRGRLHSRNSATRGRSVFPVQCLGLMPAKRAWRTRST